MWRNKEEHNINLVRHNNPSHYIFHRVKEYEEARKMTKHITTNNVRNRSAVWKPPLVNMVMLNSDGASKENKVASCGGIIRDTRGDWIGGFSIFFWKL